MPYFITVVGVSVTTYMRTVALHMLDWCLLPPAIACPQFTKEVTMPIVAQIICDGCQTVKKETNHWYTLVLNDQHEACIRPMCHTPPSLLQLGAAHVSYYCGMRCAIDGITQWMDGMTS